MVKKKKTKKKGEKEAMTRRGIKRAVEVEKWGEKKVE